LLHPTIVPDVKNKTPSAQILDLGTATGLWAIEASKAYPDAIIKGLDIADTQFSPPGTLPKNLTFSKYNFFNPVPRELVGQFDVVHTSYITPALFRRGRDTVITHVNQFLKPGG
jgi:ubiquinone/menaquinone biosynthesis C-methylase UbiE